LAKGKKSYSVTCLDRKVTLHVRLKERAFYIKNVGELPEDLPLACRVNATGDVQVGFRGDFEKAWSVVKAIMENTNLLRHNAD
jgi:hypothetical protein